VAHTKKNRNKADESMRFITRIDSKRAKGWTVRLYQKGDRSPLASKFFSDSKYLSMADALDAAKIWRDQQVKIHHLDRYKHVDAPKAHFCNTRSKSGAVGVSLSFKSSSSGAIHAYWIAKTVIANDINIKHWSIHRHGYKGAWKKAVDYRLKITGQPVTENKPPSPEERIVEWAREYDINLSK
jgi:hypothetical protein